MQNDMHPKKSLGQNFLTDLNIAKKIVRLADVSPGDFIVEVGPGRGILTQMLLDQGAHVQAIEKDARLENALRERFSAFPNLEWVFADACTYPYHEIVSPFRVVANLPYNVAIPILFRIMEAKAHLTDMVVMVQKEVADRLTASPGSKAYGALSVNIQALADIKALFTVPPHCFRPCPKVVSTVVRITPNPTKIHLENRVQFKTVVAGAFAHRRKHLMNALEDAGFARALLEAMFKKVGLAPDCRAETQTVQAFALLANALEDSKNR